MYLAMQPLRIHSPCANQVMTLAHHPGIFRPKVWVELRKSFAKTLSHFVKFLRELPDKVEKDNILVYLQILYPRYALRSLQTTL